MPIRPVNINNGCPTPNPAPVSKSGANNQDTELKFQAADSKTYTLTGLNACLDAPSSVAVSPGNPAGPYSPLSSASGECTYEISPPCPAAAPPSIIVNP